ncbi:MAG TPA: coenzyme F420-0:L-glutamate ligase [Actinomycetota bacterium]|nr:coenzyme F420-0:L-glutamate ligase [Actinomycetota bacterium]
MTPPVTVVPVEGLPEVAPGDDLAAMIAGGIPLEDGDVVVVTQKVVSKSEGRVVEEGEGREAWVARESRRVVARRGSLVIAQTVHGFVCANAGVDASNVAPGFLTLLPEDPDASAARIRDGLRRRASADVAVVVSDTFGRPWRRGLVNVAIGAAGLPALLDLRGTADRQGRILEATVAAVADEAAAAAGLVMGKADGVPVAVVRGARWDAPPGRAADLVRPPEEDLFRYSPLQTISTRRSVREFADRPVPREALVEAVAAALTAPVPHGSRHRAPPWVWVVLDTPAARRRLLGAMAEAWTRDLGSDGVSPDVIDRRLARSDALLGAAPVLAVPCLSLGAADRYPDERRRQAERDMFVLATGAGVQNLMLALHAQGYASCWVSSTLFCAEESRAAMGLADEWLPMGSVAAGAPLTPPPARPPRDPGTHLRTL